MKFHVSRRQGQVTRGVAQAFCPAILPCFTSIAPTSALPIVGSGGWRPTCSGLWDATPPTKDMRLDVRL